MKKYKFTINGVNFNVAIKSVEDDIANIEVNGSKYAVKLNEEVKTSKTPVLQRKRVKKVEGENKEKLQPVAASKRPSAKTVKAPLPGNVFKVLVKEGDSFKADEVIMVLESMKMENNVLADRDGTVTKVLVKEGDAVLQDADLFEIE
ncbi:MAG: acetyl-CoA carboxylase biotin carboxyl carrier protein subunit [Flavobacteriia bacterium]|nr:MAG: acetyl-CoA carboxylase biotin carboxyl carrier protein subunit [Flavobacteriia bacterium]